MAKGEKAHLWFVTIVATLFICMYVTTYIKYPERLDPSFTIIVIFSVMNVANSFIDIYHKKAFAKDETKDPPEYKHPIKHRKKWSQIFLVKALLISVYFYFLLVLIAGSTLFRQAIYYFIGLMVIIYLALIFKWFNTYRKYGEIDPNENYTILGHRKIETEEK